jgi:hypothetical protein
MGTAIRLSGRTGWLGGGGGAETFPSAPVGSPVGHLLFGTVLGAVFATIVDLHAPFAERPLEP